MKRSLILAVSLCTLVPLLEAAQKNQSQSVAVLSAVAPLYPPIALTANLSGDVEVAVTIDKSGSVTSADFVSGSPLLHKAAVEAAKRWKFEKLDVGKRLPLTFSFRMVPKDTLGEDMTSVFMPPYHLEVRGKLPPPTVNYDSSAHPTTTQRPICTIAQVQHAPLAHKFTGKQRDSESGLDNFGARFDSSNIGRFTSPDPGNAGASEDAPQSWNAYSYLENNPTNVTDPDGRETGKTEENRGEENRGQTGRFLLFRQQAGSNRCLLR